MFTTSFGLEDQAILHWIAELGLDIDVVTLDTGRLFPETYEVWAETEQRYGRRIRAVYPDHSELEALVARQGINGFYESARSADFLLPCPQGRAAEPRARRRRGLDHRACAPTSRRSGREISVLEHDAERGLLKLNPLFDWTREAIRRLRRRNAIPLNALHARASSRSAARRARRAIAPGEPERAGRWWWEEEDKKECGLHHRLAG